MSYLRKNILFSRVLTVSIPILFKQIVPKFYERQQVIATQVTSDPAQDDCICDTVRLGYLFQGRLIRPQETIVYCFQSEDERP